MGRDPNREPLTIAASLGSALDPNRVPFKNGCGWAESTATTGERAHGRRTRLPPVWAMVRFTAACRRPRTTASAGARRVHDVPETARGGRHARYRQSPS
jgi:hypothetical protein